MGRAAVVAVKKTEFESVAVGDLGTAGKEVVGLEGEEKEKKTAKMEGFLQDVVESKAAAEGLKELRVGKVE